MTNGITEIVNSPIGQEKAGWVNITRTSPEESYECNL